jgi:MYXO-CTERM domain-containing protein
MLRAVSAPAVAAALLSMADVARAQPRAGGGSPAKDDSGCATASGSSTLPLLGSAVGVGILVALRRRRSRKKS